MPFPNIETLHGSLAGGLRGVSRSKTDPISKPCAVPWPGDCAVFLCQKFSDCAGDAQGWDCAGDAKGSDCAGWVGEWGGREEADQEMKAEGGYCSTYIFICFVCFLGLR